MADKTPASAALSKALFSGSSGSDVPKLPEPNERFATFAPSFTALSMPAIIASVEALSFRLKQFCMQESLLLAQRL